MTEFTLEKLRTTAAACVGVSRASELKPGNLDVSIDDLGYDSLAFYELMTRLEDELTISIPDSDIDGLDTPRAIIDYINGRLAELAS